MKRIEDIEKMSMEQLEAIASDDSVKAPASLEAKVDSALVAGAMKRKQSRSSRPVFYSFATAMSAAAVCLAVSLAVNRQPKDTFDDPYEAYAELEKTFAYISRKMDKGIEMAAQAELVFDRTAEVFNTK